MFSTGHRYVHWWFQTRFSEKKPTLTPEVDPWADVPPLILNIFDQEGDIEEENYELLCQSSNLGCYVILLGKIFGRDRLDVTHGMVVSGRELLHIPLEMSGLPSPKEFKDNVGSLSDKQREFASAYRSLQLSGTLFGVCVIQVKPHLEELLGLSVSSLAKEIELTNEILSLFLEFGISSDMMRVDEREREDGEVGCERKRELVQMVAKNVGRVTEMINREREEILERQRRIEEARRREEERKRRLEEERRRKEEEERRRLEQLRLRREQERQRRSNRRNTMQKQSIMITSAPKRESRSFFPSLFSGFSARKELALPSDDYAMCDDVDGFAPAFHSRFNAAPSSICRDDGGDFYSDEEECMLLRETIEKEEEQENAEDDAVDDGDDEMGGEDGEDDDEPHEKEEEAEDQKEEESEEKKDKESKEEKEKRKLSLSFQQEAEDYTKIPSQLDKEFEKRDKDGAVRSVTITPKSEWHVQSHPGGLAPPSGKRRKTSHLSSKDLESEKKRALDLLDILSRSGDKTLYAAELHVVVCSRHSFVDSLWRTLVQRNTNPIEGMERSALIGSSVVLRESPKSLLSVEGLERSSSSHCRLRDLF